MNNILKKIVRFMMMLVIVFLIIPVPASRVQASGMEDIDGATGNITKRNYYSLDIEECGLLDAGSELINGLANILFSFFKIIAYLTCTFFCFCMTLDITALLTPEINAIQGAMKSSIFDTLFVLGFAGASIVLIKKMLHRDLAGAYGELLKVVFIVTMAVLLTRNSSEMLKAFSTVTKEVSVQILASVNNSGETDITKFATGSAEVLWNNLIHEPWKTLEFGDQIQSDEFIADLLEDKPGSEGRTDFVEANKTLFPKTMGGERIANMLAYFFPFLGKCLVYMIVVAIQLLFQVTAIFYLFLGILVLALSMVPGYDLDLFGIWLKKILETQLGILIITLLLGFMIKIDTILFSLVPTIGWLPVCSLQLMVLVGLVIGRKQILSAFTNIRKGMSSSGYAKAKFRNSSNVVSVPKVAGNVKRAVGDTKGSIENVQRKIQRWEQNSVKEHNPENAAQRTGYMKYEKNRDSMDQAERSGGNEGKNAAPKTTTSNTSSDAAKTKNNVVPIQPRRLELKKNEAAMKQEQAAGETVREQRRLIAQQPLALKVNEGIQEMQASTEKKEQPRLDRRITTVAKERPEIERQTVTGKAAEPVIPPVQTTPRASAVPKDMKEVEKIEKSEKPGESNPTSIKAEINIESMHAGRSESNVVVPQAVPKAEVKERPRLDKKKKYKNTNKTPAPARTTAKAEVSQRKGRVK